MMRWLLLALIVATAPAEAMTQAEKCEIIRQDIARYLATGHPCTCPYSVTRRGTQCGDWSAWAKPGGRAPRCYFSDVDGTTPPNEHPNPTRESWPPPPPCQPGGR